MRAAAGSGFTGPPRPGTWRAAHLEMSRLIEEIELLTTAQASTVVALARAGGDTEEARQCLYAQMDRLNALRRQRAVIERFDEIQPRAEDPR